MVLSLLCVTFLLSFNVFSSLFEIFEYLRCKNIQIPFVVTSVGRSSISLQDLLAFATGSAEPPAVGLLPPPSISFLHPPTSSPPGFKEDGRAVDWRDKGLFPQSEPESRHLLLPVTTSYQTFKSSMEQAISHHVHLLPTESYREVEVEVEVEFGSACL